MVDIHSHVLWGMDDGARTPEESLSLLKLAELSGTTDIFATPHIIGEKFQPSWHSIEERTAELNQMAAAAGINIHVYSGAEVEMNWNLLEFFTGPGGLFCLANSRYVLVELPVTVIPEYADEFWYQLQLKGISPILAHAERYPVLAKHPEILLQWVKKGILVQSNTGSFVNKFGPHVQVLAEKLLTNNLVHFLGSDAHNMQNRNTDNSKALKRISELVGEEKTRELAVLNPQYILEDKLLIPVVPDVISAASGENKSFWHRLFK